MLKTISFPVKVNTGLQTVESICVIKTIIYVLVGAGLAQLGTSYGLDGQVEKGFLLLHVIQVGSGTLTASYHKGTELFPHG